MTSQALRILDERIAEVRALQEVDPAASGRMSLQPAEQLASDAIARASVVLLCGHLEGFVEDLLLESVDRLVTARIVRERVPIALRYQHARKSIEEVSQMRDPSKFVEALEQALSENHVLYLGERLAPGCLQPTRLKDSFASPSCEKIGGLFAILGLRRDEVLVDSFPSGRLARVVTRTLDSMVAVRHAVAHGELQANVTRQDVARYASALRFFAARLDLAVESRVSELTLGTHPTSAAPTTAA